MQKLILLLCLCSSLASAEKPKFLCFQFGGTKPQVFEYQTQSCKTEPITSLGKKNGYQDAMCAYHAFCAPSINDKELEAFKIPDPNDRNEHGRLMMENGFRMSMVMCKGQAPYVGGFICLDPSQNCPPIKCPSIEKCLTQATYNTPGLARNVVDLDSNQPHSKKPSKFLVNPQEVTE